MAIILTATATVTSTVTPSAPDRHESQRLRYRVWHDATGRAIGATGTGNIDPGPTDEHPKPYRDTDANSTYSDTYGDAHDYSDSADAS